MRFLVSLLTVLLLVAPGAQAQTAATYADRARLAGDSTFHGRVSIAAMVGAVSVITEDVATADHAIRVRLAGAVLRDPDGIGRRLSQVLAATVTATVDAEGTVSTPLTDAQLQSVITTRWTAIATALVGAS